ncbi:MAG: prevent-host-death family protein [uncultured bacterium]|nr:MAG: prevent-host-death family protein [uncultured bacterium]
MFVVKTIRVLFSPRGEIEFRLSFSRDMMYNTIDSTIKNTMNNFVTANDLKTKGVSAIEPFAKKGLETVITVRGVDTYVVLTTQAFNHLRECELTAALIESERDMKKGKYHKGSVEEHLKRITNG